MRAYIVAEFFYKSLREIVGPDDRVEIFALFEVVVVEPRLVGEKAPYDASPFFGESLFILFVRVSYERTRGVRIEKIYVREGRVSGAMTAFFLSENENFPLQGSDFQGLFVFFS